MTDENITRSAQKKQNTPKRILITLKDISEQGGGERVGVNLANAFVRELGANVRVVSFFRAHAKPFYALDERVELFCLCERGAKGKNPLRNLFHKSLFRLWLSYKTRKFAQNADIVLANDGWFVPFCKVRSSAKSLYIRLWHLNAPKRPKKKLALFDALVVLSSKELPLWQRYHSNVRVIPNFLPQIPAKSTDSSQKVVLSVGRMDNGDQKGFLRLLDIWKIVQDRIKSPLPKSLPQGEGLSLDFLSLASGVSQSPLSCKAESKASPLPCASGLGVGKENQSNSLADKANGWVKTDKSPSHRPLAPYMKEFSRAMRKNPAQAENKLWQELRAKKLGFGFRRQFVIDSKYIADFVCLEKRLIIECDGGQHNQSFGDTERDFYLEFQNFRILRFWNDEILENLEGVLSVIKKALESDLNPCDFANAKLTHPLTPSAKGGGIFDLPSAREGEQRVQTPQEKSPSPCGRDLGRGIVAMERKNVNIQDLHEWQLIIVGDGILKSEIEAKIKALNLQDSVILKPFTKEIEKEYLSASIYAMSSHFEGFPMVLIESISYGLAPISFDIKTGPSDIIADNQSGFLVKDNDLQGYADKLITLMCDENLRANFGTKAKALVSERFGKDAVLKLWEELFEKG